VEGVLLFLKQESVIEKSLRLIETIELVLRRNKV
jgi:hypothetical protein